MGESRGTPRPRGHPGGSFIFLHLTREVPLCTREQAHAVQHQRRLTSARLLSDSSESCPLSDLPWILRVYSRSMNHHQNATSCLVSPRAYSYGLEMQDPLLVTNTYHCNEGTKELSSLGVQLFPMDNGLLHFAATFGDRRATLESVCEEREKDAY
ncbi:hypothetical protein L209DRAFT_4039 [Thermothelomyces heterothallicus CBS 203.75]